MVHHFKIVRVRILLAVLRNFCMDSWVIIVHSMYTLRSYQPQIIPTSLLLMFMIANFTEFNNGHLYEEFVSFSYMQLRCGLNRPHTASIQLRKNLV